MESKEVTQEVKADQIDLVREGVETAVECNGENEMQEEIRPPPCDHSKLESKIKELKKELEQVAKVKDAMVMRYANSEKEVIRKSKEVENVEKQYKAQIRETEALQRKTKMLTTERERLAGMIDLKVCEIQSIQKELEKAREEISNKEFKVKWTYSKLQNEIEAHKATMARLEKCESDLIESMAEAERMRSDCRQMIASCSPEPYAASTNSENTMESSISYTVDGKDSEKSIMTNGHIGSGSRSPAAEAFLKEIEILKQKHKNLVEENSTLSFKVQNLEQLRHENEHKINRLQESSAEHLLQIANLTADLAASESAKSQLLNEQERITSISTECQQLRELNAELLSDMAICREKEAELLEYTQQVTVKNVHLQSEFSALETKSSLALEETSRLRKVIETLKSQAASFEQRTKIETDEWLRRENELIDQMKIKDELINKIQTELDESRGECTVLKKRHESSLKELRKELDSLRRQCRDGVLDDSMSRTSSNTSLNQADSKSCDSSPTIPLDMESGGAIIPDQRALVERIVKLQRSLAKKQEKIEFLQEHGKQLLDGLQNKSKIIQAYAMNQVGGALTTDISTHHKTEMAKQGFDVKLASDPLTLDVSIELNRKLQAVLEDALMKNITMKESMRTLGSEICRLTELNKELSNRHMEHQSS